jgi:trigger factor
MASQLENTGSLERRLTLSVPTAEVTKKVQERYRSLARTVRMPGFRPGKVPLKLIEQSYGQQVQAEILGDAVSKAFSDAVDEHKLRVAGQPAINPKEGAQRPRISPRPSRSIRTWNSPNPTQCRSSGSPARWAKPR